MKDFLKFTLASLVGVVLAGVVFIVLGIISVVGMMTSSDTETVVKDNSIFVLDFKGNLTERAQDNPLQQLLGEDFETYGLNDVLSSIRKAAENENIKGIYLRPSYLGASFASLQEIRRALLDFKATGKFIVAYADAYTQGMYYLSSVADKVIVNPQGSIGWHGLGMQPVFFKNLIGKLGIEAQVFRVGTYKSAVEPFIGTEMSLANREQSTEMLTSIWQQLLDDISASRGISADTLNAYADRFMDLCKAPEYAVCGLADTLMYNDEVLAYLKQMSGREEDESLRSLFLEDMINVKRNVPRDKSGDVIAVYYASGEILDQASGTSTDECIDASVMCRDLRSLRDDNNVKAVVLRVNSPGGSAYASEQIWREVVRLKEKKPVVVSMSDYAASGGYYISCAATRILAQSTTLTGSIGIFGLVFSADELLTKTAGLNFDVVKTNRLSDFGASTLPNLLNRPLNEAEQTIMQNYVNQGYELFVNRCADGRGISVEDLKKIAEGRVWTGAKAVELGLVDELGGMDKALETAAALADVQSYSVLSYPKQKSMFSNLLDTQKKHFADSEIKAHLGDFYPAFKALEDLKGTNSIQARMPFNLHIQQ